MRVIDQQNRSSVVKRTSINAGAFQFGPDATTAHLTANNTGGVVPWMLWGDIRSEPQLEAVAFAEPRATSTSHAPTSIYVWGKHETR